MVVGIIAIAVMVAIFGIISVDYKQTAAKRRYRQTPSATSHKVMTRNDQ